MKMKAFALSALAMVLVGCSSSEGAVGCLPDGVDENQGAEVQQAKQQGLPLPRATLYLDLSLSMVNFLDGKGSSSDLAESPDYSSAFQYGALVRRLPPILRQMTQRFVLAGFSVNANKKLNRLAPKYDITDEQFRQLTATECFLNSLNKKPREECKSLYRDNQRTDFSGLFPDVESRVKNGELVVIVSDLMSYGAGQLGDYNDIAGPLSALIRDGYAVALLSALVGYNGNVMDIPGGRIKVSGKMPFHILAIGASGHVDAVLRTIGSDPGFSKFRAQGENNWRVSLFDPKAGPAITLGTASINQSLPRGVLRTGTGLVDSKIFAGQFVVARTAGDEKTSREIEVKWPVLEKNPFMPVEYELQPESKVWVYLPGANGQCRDGWRLNKDVALQSIRPESNPRVPVGDSNPSAKLVRQSLFSSGIPPQMASRTTYLWQLEWALREPKRSPRGEEYLKEWSINASGIDELRARTSGKDEVLRTFRTYDLDAIYNDLWQYAYGSRAPEDNPARYSALVSAVVQ